MSRWPHLFTLLTIVLVLTSAKFTWPDGDDGRYTVWAIALAHGEGLTNSHLPEPTPEAIVPPGLSLVLAPVAALFGAGNLKAMMAFSALLLIALAWIYARWGVNGCGMRDSGKNDSYNTSSSFGIPPESRTSDPASGVFDLASRIPHPAPLSASTVYSLPSTVYISVLALWGVFTISSAWRVHTEILYMLLSFSAFALWPEQRDQRIKILICGMLAGAAFMTRTVGLALLPAGIIALAFRRQWLNAVVYAVGFLGINAPLSWRTQQLTGSILPYTQYAGGSDTGLLDKLHSLFTFATHYIFYGLPDLMFYRLISPDGLLEKAHIGFMSGTTGFIIGGLVIAGLLVRLIRFDFPALYFAAYFVIISSFNQADYAARGEFLFQDRYVIPVIPLAAIYLVVACSFVNRIKWKPVTCVASIVPAMLAAYVALTAVVSAYSRFTAESYVRSLHPMDPARYVRSENENDRAWGSYFACAFWLQSNAPPGSVIFCRKPQEMYLASGHKSDRYIEHGTGTNLLAAIKTYSSSGSYVIEDAFSTSTAYGKERTGIIEPLLQDYGHEFELVYTSSDSPARIWRVKP